MWKSLEHAAGAKTPDREHQLNRVTKRVDQHCFVRVALESTHCLILIRTRRGMETNRRAELLRFAPERIVIAVVNVAALCPLQHETQADRAQLRNSAARLVD